MSVERWTKHGYHGPLMREWDCSLTWGQGSIVKVYYIGDANLVGVEYPDKARQAQPVVWYGTSLQAALAEMFKNGGKLPRTYKVEAISKADPHAPLIRVKQASDEFDQEHVRPKMLIRVKKQQAEQQAEEKPKIKVRVAPAADAKVRLKIKPRGKINLKKRG